MSAGRFVNPGIAEAIVLLRPYVTPCAEFKDFRSTQMNTIAAELIKDLTDLSSILLNESEGERLEHALHTIVSDIINKPTSSYSTYATMEPLLFPVTENKEEKNNKSDLAKMFSTLGSKAQKLLDRIVGYLSKFAKLLFYSGVALGVGAAVGTGVGAVAGVPLAHAAIVGGAGGTAGAGSYVGVCSLFKPKQQILNERIRQIGLHIQTFGEQKAADIREAERMRQSAIK